MAKAITENALFYGDNLEILRDYVIDESVDLIYLDPLFPRCGFRASFASRLLSIRVARNAMQSYT